MKKRDRSLELFEDYSAVDRIKIVVVGALLGVIAGWLWFFLDKFTNTRTWGDLLVRLVLKDFAVIVGLFAIGLLIHGLFLPEWLNKILAKSQEKTIFAVAALWTLFLLATFLVMVVLPILSYFGIFR
jgi:hypothetical protein